MNEANNELLQVSEKVFRFVDVLNAIGLVDLIEMWGYGKAHISYPKHKEG